MKSVLFSENIKNVSLRTELLRAIRNHWTHDSTALEGNTLTLGDTDFVLSEGLTVSGKPLSHHQEVYGHAKAIELIYGMLNKNIEQSDLFLLHQAVLSERVVDIYFPVGQWKNEANFTFYVRDNKRVQHEYPRPEVVPTLMDEWLKRVNEWCDKIKSPADAVRSYAELHAIFVAIHPFVDGNGRMARLLANLPLLKNGFPPINIPSEDRMEYLSAIADITCQCGDVSLQRHIGNIVDEAAIQRFAVLCTHWWQPILELVAGVVQKDLELQRNSPGGDS